MRLNEIRSIAALVELPVFEASDPQANRITDTAHADDVAEAADMMRVQELLHRTEYRPIAAVRAPAEGPDCVRVYFQRWDDGPSGQEPKT
ncbi:MAG: hypothetical protein WD069_15525 [Planctomycetales bacterium]